MAASATGQPRPTPRFSVLIPVWRGSPWIVRAIDSVRAQSFPDWELVLGDNASDDDTVALAREVEDARIRVVTWPDHVGIFENFERSFAMCQGEWVYLLPVDDVLMPDALERIAATIDAHGGARPLVAVLPRARRVAPDGRRIDVVYHGVQAEAWIEGGTYDATGWLRAVTRPGSPPWDGGAFRRGAVEAMGRFYRTDVPSMSADFELDIRIATQGDVAFLDEPVLAVTGSPTSDTPGRVRRNLSSGEPFTPRGRALLEGLRAHEMVRDVGSEERRWVAAAIARSHLRRATAHRTTEGGRGRRGALLDVRAAWELSPRTVIASLPQAVASVLVPAWALTAARTAVLAIRSARRA